MLIASVAGVAVILAIVLGSVLGTRAMSGSSGAGAQTASLANCQGQPCLFLIRVDRR